MTTVLLTGAGGAAVSGLIERLKRAGYRVLAADMDQYAVGLYLADAGFIIPPGTSPDFLPAIHQICLHEMVDVFIPLVDEELITALELEERGFIVLLPKREFVATCLDKFSLMQRLQAVDIPIPATRLASTGLGEMHFPLVVKPRKGRGSRGVSLVNSEKELFLFLENCGYAANDLIFQEYVQGPEFTVSVVVWRDGKVQAVVPKEIICKRGITQMAITRHNPEIERLCHRIQEKLHADGPFNVQLRIDQNTGEPLLFEINPRFSTTISLTIAAGIDELGGLVAQAIGGRDKHHFGEWQEGIVLLRRSLDEFIDESNFRQHQIVKMLDLIR